MTKSIAAAMRHGRVRAVALALLVYAVTATGTASASWTQAQAAGGPSARSVPAMAYDAARERVVLFGGSGVEGELGDTWLWDGSAWSQASPARSPAARFASSMAYDEARGETILFGGSSLTLPLGDTWVWNGATWTQKVALPSPPPRSGAMMAYHAASGKVVLFGGFAAGPSSTVGDGDARVVSDTWTWDGSRWTLERPATKPPARQLGMLAPGPDGRLVLFGGSTQRGSFEDTWAWDGSNWTRIETPTHPSGRHGSGFAYDPVERVTLLTGGLDLNAFLSGADPEQFYVGEVWAFDGATWHRRTETPEPSARAGAAMAYDAARSTAVLFGGVFNNQSLNETWLHASARKGKKPKPR